MKRNTEFRRRLSSIEYDATAGQFVEDPFTSMQDMPPEQPAEPATSKLQADGHVKPEPGIDERGWDMFSSICAYIRTNPTPISAELAPTRKNINKSSDVYYVDPQNCATIMQRADLELKSAKQF